MTEWLTSPHVLIGLLIAGTALIFQLADGDSPSTRALSLCLTAISLAVFIGTRDRGFGSTESVSGALAGGFFEVLAILAGIEWGRRIGLTTQGRIRTAGNVLQRSAQILVLVYGGLLFGYILIFPEHAVAPVSGPVRLRGVEFAVFAPVLGTGILLSAIGLILLRFLHTDRAETVRLRALQWAAPFLLAALVLADDYVPLALMGGLLVFLYGSIRYLMIQSRRGQFMSQFLSPEVARLVRNTGVEQVMRRERRVLSVVMCDLRGFTAYARQQDSDAVASLLERYYAVVGRVTAAHGGTVKDHAGDGVLILVGAPLPLADHAPRALHLGLALIEELRELLRDSGLGVGVGIATGNTTVGAIRGAGRLEYVAVGNAVNLAARLSARAEAGEVLSDRRTADASENVQSEPRPPEQLKGFVEPVPVCAIRAAQGAAAVRNDQI